MNADKWNRECSSSDSKEIQKLIDDYFNAKDKDKQGVDITNLSDPFFTDICFPYTTQNNTDVTLRERHLSYLDASVFCDTNCIFERFDYG